MSTARKLRLLFWKYLLLCKHKWLLTTFEICLPVIFVFLLCAFNGILPSFHSNNSTLSPTKPQTVVQFINKTSDIFGELVFAPNTTFTNNIILSASQLLNPEKNHLQIVSKNTDEEVIEAVAAAKFYQFNSNDDVNVMGVYFMDSYEHETAPNKFSYKIHLSNAPYTREMFASLFSPPRDDVYVDSGFAGVQVALDIAFIRYHKLNEREYEKVMIGRFPYPDEAPFQTVIRSQLLAYVCPIIILTTFFQAIPLIFEIILEKESGVKELMKIVGLGEYLIWISWLLNSLSISILPITFITYLLRLDMSGENTSILKFVDATVLWSFLVLFVIANITFCFLFCAIFHKTTYAGFLYFLTVIFIVLESYFEDANVGGNIMRMVTCIFPQTVLARGFNQIKVYEFQGLTLSWSSLFHNERNANQHSLGYTFITLLLQALFYLLLTYYISAINPGPFGARKSPFFIFRFLCCSRSKDSWDDSMKVEETSNNKYIENGPVQGKPSIRIKNLWKNFKGVNAVKGINLNIYENEITALLGHNGAGKTTTIAMLTGLIKPSGGSIVYKNYLEVFEKMDDFRSKLGVCLQENRLFPYLSVLNHLLFFGMLKGFDKTEAKEEAMYYLSLMDMFSGNNTVSRLSGGMKRKLCLAIALMGKAEILILDEPTTGLDAQFKRKIWDFLRSLRGSRTIILTTHHMEEADVLGDRIAIMKHGKIECHGTPLFLKKVYGASYKLTITKEDEDSDNETLTEEITKHVPDATLQVSRMHELVYHLPLTETANFPAMFEALKRERQNLGIKSIGVNCTAMEDVFLRTAGSVNDNFNNTTNYGSFTVAKDHSQFDTANKKKKGLSLIIQQLLALIRKKYLYSIRSCDTFITRVLFPTLLTLLIMWIWSPSFHNFPMELSLSTYPHSSVMVQNDTQSESYLTEKFTQYVRESGGQLIFNENSTIEEGLLKYSHDHLLPYRTEMILAAQFNNSGKLILFNSFTTHSLGIALNTYANAFLRARSNNSLSVVAINHPVITNSLSKTIALMILWGMVFAWLSVDLIDFFTIPIRTELSLGFKHIQLTSGVSPIVYWLSNILYDSFYFLLIIVARLLLLSPYSYPNLWTSENIAMIFVIFAAFIPAGLFFSYAMSSLVSAKESSHIYSFFLNLAGIVIVIFVYTNMILADVLREFVVWGILMKIATYVVFLLPPLNLLLIFIKFLASSSKIFENMSNGAISETGYLIFMDGNHPNGFLQEYLFLIADIFVYAAILTLVEMDYVSKTMNRIKSNYSSSDCPIYDEPPDENVRNELYKLAEMAEKSTDGSQKKVILLVSKLKKDYTSFFRPTLTAVHDVTFVVETGQCFGLLGVNGAGKTSTFKILAGEIQPTEGKASINNYWLNENRSKYLSKTGYCPQANCFVKELTGREMLTLMASLRGLYNVDKIVNKWLSILGLQTYQNYQCGWYSGGNKRKLCTAMSLIGDPNVVFLDEPTSGVDPISKRKLYDVMDSLKSAGQAVVLTSHSMDECEKLCDRLTIMAEGRMKCIGSPQELKHQFAQGFSVQIKLHDKPSSEKMISAVKKSMVEYFKPDFCHLKDEHNGFLYYQISDTELDWSESFSKMEQIKSSHDIIDDYVITDTSMEQVFLSFAK